MNIYIVKLASLTKWFSVRLWTKWLWVRVQLQSFIVCETNLRPFTVGQKFMLGNSLFGAVKLTTNADPDKYKYFSFGIRFDASGSFLMSNGSGFDKNFIFGASTL